MPTVHIWRGDCQPRPQVTRVTPSNPEIGDVFILTINRKDYRFTATASTVHNVCAGLVDLIGVYGDGAGGGADDVQSIAEFNELAAEMEYGNEATPTLATAILITGPLDGTPFTLEKSTTNAGDFAIEVETVREGVPRTNEQQRVQLSGPPTGGTFTLTFDGQTTAAIAYNASANTVRDALCDLSNIAGTDEVQRLTSTATGGTFRITFEGQQTGAIAFNASAATIQTALEALSNIAVGDVVCAGGALNVAFVSITFRETLGRSDRTEVTIDNTSATGGTVVPSTTTAGVASDVTVTLSATSNWIVEFGGAYTGVNVPLMSGSGASLTGVAALQFATTTQGTQGVNEVQDIRLGPLFGQESAATWQGIFTDVNDVTHYTPFFAHDASAATVQAGFEGLPTIGSGNVTVTKSTPTEANGTFIKYRITFVGAKGFQDVPAIVTVWSIYQDANVQVVTEGSSTGDNEVQTCTVVNAPTGGTFTVTWAGQTTAAMDYNISGALFQSALEAMSNIAPGDVAVVRTGSGTLSAPYVYTTTFQGTYASTDVSQMTGSAASLTGGAINIAVIQDSSTGLDEVEQITVTGGPSGGTFTLTFNAQTTGAIAYDASAATVLAALEGLATPVPGDFSVVGGAGGPWVVTFTGAYAKTDVTAITGDGTNLTGGGTQDLTIASVVSPTGPNWWSDPENWMANVAKVAGDTIIFENSDVSCLYGIEDDAATQFLRLEEKASYTGHIGLPIWNSNGYFEYRPRALKSRFTTVVIGEGPGSGSEFTRLDLQAFASTIICLNTADPENTADSALHILNTHANSILRVFKGNVGVASEVEGQTSQLATLQVGLKDSEESDAIVICGEGLTVATIAKSGGYLETWAGFTTGTQEKGTWRAGGTGNSTKMLVYGGDCFLNLVGTHTKIRTADGGKIYCREQMETIVITSLTMEAGSGFLDPYGVATPTALELDRCSLLEVELDLGSHIQLVATKLAA